MTRIRLRLIVYAIAVLVCQGAAISAAPIALCRGALSAVDEDECCRNLKPGQTCPMHHKTNGSPERRGSAWTCPCSASRNVLASIVGVSGALPKPIRISDPAARVAAVVSLSPSTLDHQPSPPYQPPRASCDFRCV